MAARKPSLQELRKRYLEAGKSPSRRVLGELAADPRKGAQSLHRALIRQRDAAKAEKVRLESMLHFERVLWRAGIDRIAGTDEVGIGPLAGPVVAAAVILPADIDVAEVDDSKRLDEDTRERLDQVLRERAVAVAVCEIAVEEVDQRNVYHAGLEAMRRAVLDLAPGAQHLLTDARTVPGLGDLPQNAFKRGDGLSYSIAAASIIAKVHRDRRMLELAAKYPGYGFENHKGYGTAEHMAAVTKLGPCAIHRRSFPVIRELTGDAGERFYELKAALDGATTLAALDEVKESLGAASAELAATEARKLGTLLGRRRKKLESL